MEIEGTPSMLILHPKTPGNVRVLIMSAILLVGGACAATTSGKMAVGELTSKQQLLTLRIGLVEAISRSEEMPDAPPIVQLVGKPAMSSKAGGGWILVPLVSTYERIANKYCRVAVADPSLKNIKLVPVPQQALYDMCFGLRPVFFTDVNGDGQMDVVHGVRVMSNRTNAIVTEVAVYLSSDQSDVGYCYSADASAQLTPADLKSSAAAATAVERAQQRLHIGKFTCSPLP